jgi:hypothetical protein
LCGDPDAHRLAGLLPQGKWRELADFLHAQTDLELRDFYIRMLPNHVKGWPSWLDQWVETEPQDPLARLFRASRFIRYAWEARGSGNATSVDSGNWPLFFSRLEAADADLEVAANLAPNDPGPWVLMISTARGRQLDIAEERRRFAEVERRHPFHPLACRQLLQAVAAKWGGSHEMMFELAHSIDLRAPEGAPAHALIPEAHFEYWLQERDTEKNYWGKPEVRDDVVAAAQRCFTNAQHTPHMVIARNTFALAYYFMGFREQAREQFDQVGGVITEPWTLFPSPVSMVRKALAVPKNGAGTKR